MWTQVGRGAQAFEAARGVLGRWGHFQLGWAAVDPGTGTAEGAPVTVTAKTLFLWTCNPLRIVWVGRVGGGGAGAVCAAQRRRRLGLGLGRGGASTAVAGRCVGVRGSSGLMSTAWTTCVVAYAISGVSTRELGTMLQLQLQFQTPMGYVRRARWAIRTNSAV